MTNKDLFSKEEIVQEVRKECRQFAMLYFNFCKSIYTTVGRDNAIRIVTKAVFGLAIERTEGMRKKAEELGLDFSEESFAKLNDLPVIGWVKELGRDHCPYAKQWLTYFKSEPWFCEFAALYCDVIDTTNIENFTRLLSHRITKNVLTDENAESCEHTYFRSKDAENGKFTYGEI